MHKIKLFSLGHRFMQESILSLPPPPPRDNPGNLHAFFARGQEFVVSSFSRELGIVFLPGHYACV